LDHALAVGFAPFVLGSVLKAALAASSIEAVRRRR
jgi:biotin transporter BioY